MPYHNYEVQEFKPFDIVTAFYNDLIGQVKVDVNGKREPGLFLVLAVNDDDRDCLKEMIFDAPCEVDSDD